MQTKFSLGGQSFCPELLVLQNFCILSSLNEVMIAKVKEYIPFIFRSVLSFESFDVDHDVCIRMICPKLILYQSGDVVDPQPTSMCSGNDFF